MTKLNSHTCDCIVIGGGAAGMMLSLIHIQMCIRDRTWGGYLPNDVQIAKDLGLGYGVYKTSNIYGKSTHYEYLDYEFTECDEISSMKALTEYFTQNISVINRIVDLFEKDMPAKGYTFI